MKFLFAVLSIFLGLPAVSPAQTAPAPVPPRVDFIHDIVIGHGGDRVLHAELLRPHDLPAQPMPAIVFIHGGGWFCANWLALVKRVRLKMSMTRFVLSALALALAGFALCACSKSDGLGAPVTEPGYFSYREPAGWTVQDYDLMNFVSCLGPEHNGFAPKIEAADHHTDQAAPDFVQSHDTGADFDMTLHDVELVDQRPFTTLAGATGIRNAVTYTFNSQNLERVVYFFEPIKGHIFVFTGTCLAADGATYGPVFDRSLKTLVFAVRPVPAAPAAK
jgi:hypothetical protein